MLTERIKIDFSFAFLLAFSYHFFFYFLPLLHLPPVAEASAAKGADFAMGTILRIVGALLLVTQCAIGGDAVSVP